MRQPLALFGVQLAMRLPARWHGLRGRRATTAQLAALVEHCAELTAGVLGELLADEQEITERELFTPLLLWNAAWRLLERRLPGGLAPTVAARQALIQETCRFVQQPSEQRLWQLSSDWMQLRAQQDHALQALNTPILSRDPLWRPAGERDRP